MTSVTQWKWVHIYISFINQEKVQNCCLWWHTSLVLSMLLFSSALYGLSCHSENNIARNIWNCHNFERRKNRSPSRHCKHEAKRKFDTDSVLLWFPMSGAEDQSIRQRHSWAVTQKKDLGDSLRNGKPSGIERVECTVKQLLSSSFSISHLFEACKAFLQGGSFNGWMFDHFNVEHKER